MTAVLSIGLGMAKVEVINRRNTKRLDAALTTLSPSGFDDLPPADLMMRALLHKVGGRELGWVARNRPMALERMMDTTSPNSPDFWAIMLVYENYENRVKPVVARRHRERQDCTFAGLAKAGKRKGQRRKAKR